MGARLVPGSQGRLSPDPKRSPTLFLQRTTKKCPQSSAARRRPGSHKPPSLLRHNRLVPPAPPSRAPRSPCPPRPQQPLGESQKGRPRAPRAGSEGGAPRGAPRPRRSRLHFGQRGPGGAPAAPPVPGAGPPGSERAQPGAGSEPSPEQEGNREGNREPPFAARSCSRPARALLTRGAGPSPPL